VRGKQVNTTTVEYTNTYIHTTEMKLPKKRPLRELRDWMVTLRWKSC